MVRVSPIVVGKGRLLRPVTHPPCPPEGAAPALQRSPVSGGSQATSGGRSGIVPGGAPVGGIGGGIEVTGQPGVADWTLTSRWCTRGCQLTVSDWPPDQQLL